MNSPNKRGRKPGPPKASVICPVCGVAYVPHKRSKGYGCSRKCSEETKRRRGESIFARSAQITDSDREQVISLYKQGYGRHSIRHRTKFSEHHIVRICKEAGIYEPHRTSFMRLKGFGGLQPIFKSKRLSVPKWERDARRLIMAEYRTDRLALNKYDETKHWANMPDALRFINTQRKLRNFREHAKRRSNYFIATRIRTRVRNVLRGTHKSAPTLKMLGCSLDQFRHHIQRQFKRGMNWNNYGGVWHIDHIIPCATFDLSKPENQSKCFHFSNMRPEFALRNIARSDKIEPCQPELLIQYNATV